MIRIARPPRLWISFVVATGAVVSAHPAILALGGERNSAPTSVPREARSAERDGREVANVRDFGARGDAQQTRGTDDTEAFRAALRSGATRIYVPRGTYLLQGSLTIPNHTWLVGESELGTTLRFASRGGREAIVFAPDSYYQGIRDLNITHEIPYALRTGAGAGQGTAIMMTTSTYAAVERVRISNFETAFRVNGESTWLEMTDVLATHNGIAYSLSQANFTHMLRVIADANRSAFYLDSLAKPILEACTAQVSWEPTVAAVQIVDTEAAHISNLWMERNASRYGVELKGKTKNTTIMDSLLEGAGFDQVKETLTGTGTGLRIAGSVARTTLIAGRFSGNATRDIIIEPGATGTVLVDPKPEVPGTRLVVSDGAVDTQWIGADRAVLTPAEGVALGMAGRARLFVDARGVRLDSPSGPMVICGTGSPEGHVAAPKGSLYLCIDGAPGATLFVKEGGTGTTGWAAK